MRRTRAERAGIALETLIAAPASPDRLRRVLEQALVFAGAAFVGVYVPGDDPTMLCLAESAGLPRTLYGLRDVYPAAGGFPVAEAHRTGRPAWLGPDELADCPEARRTPSAEFSLGALPLGPAGSGCRHAVSEHPGGFGTDDRA